jgi:spermidine/putrescine transport system permease protein
VSESAAAAFGEGRADKGKKGKKPGSTEATAVGGSRWTPYLLLLPAAAWLGVFFVVPTLALLSTSLSTGSLETGTAFTFNVGNYTAALQEYWPHFVRSFLFAGMATLLTLAIAYPLAYTIAFKAGRWKNALLVLVIAPFFTSFLIRTLAWITILSDDGFVVTLMRDLHLTDLMSHLCIAGQCLTEPDRVLQTPLAIVTGLTYNFLPFMTLPLYAALDRMDPRLLEAGQDLYASPWTAFRKITWPLSLPGVVAGTLLTFIPAAGDYINAQLLGTSRQHMVGNVIESQFLRVGDYPIAAALSFILMASILVLVLLYVRRAGTEDLV